MAPPFKFQPLAVVSRSMKATMDFIVMTAFRPMCCRSRSPLLQRSFSLVFPTLNRRRASGKSTSSGAIGTSDINVFP